MKKGLKLFEGKYDQWIRENEEDILLVEPLDNCPLLTIVVPVYNVSDQNLTACVESVRMQTYKNWELLLIDDASNWPNVRITLEKYENIDNIRVYYRAENRNTSVAANDGIKRAKGEFITFVDCGDVISPNALYEFAKLLNENPELDFIYSDEDKITEDGEYRHTPYFKPDWSPDTFMDMMYTRHLALYRKSIIDKIGGMRSEFHGAQDYDLTLRFMELSDNNKVGHISRILYHCREYDDSAMPDIAANPDAREAGKRAKEEALIRRGYQGYTEYVEDACEYRVVYQNPKHDLVSIIILSKDNKTLLYQCLHSINDHTDYDNYEIIIVDNGSKEDLRQELRQYCSDNHILYHYQPMEFNFSKMCNIGAEIASGEYLLFLNDDIEIESDEWLSRMLGHASLSHIGAVGAKLLYPDSNRIQHIGVSNLIVGPSHILCNADDSYSYAYGKNRMNYDVLAVTGACLIVRKDRFFKVGSFDEELAVAYNDVDLCFKLHEMGLYNVVDNSIVLYHHESASRGLDNLDSIKEKRLKKDREALYSKHPNLKGNDPFYNKNLTQDRPDCSINADDPILKKCKKHADMKHKNVSTPKFNLHIDDVNLCDHIILRGWFLLDKDCDLDNQVAYLALRDSDRLTTFYEIYREKRIDVAKAFHSHEVLLGFRCVIPFSELRLDKTRYQIGICIDLESNRKNKLYWSNKWLEKISEDYYISRLQEYELVSLDNVIIYDTYKIEKCDQTNGIIQGWAFDSNSKSNDYQDFSLFFKRGDKWIGKEVSREKRRDVSSAYRRMRNNVWSGFTCKMNGDISEFVIGRKSV